MQLATHLDTYPLTASVVVPTFRRLDILKKCLAGVAAMEAKPVEILITYRPQADPETAAWLEQAAGGNPTWRLVTVTPPGVVAALNSAISQATGDIIAIFDDDAVPRPDWLGKALSHFMDPEVAAVGGRDIVHTPEGPLLVPETNIAGVRDFWGNIIGNHHLVVGPPRDVDVVKGCNWALRRSALGTLRLDERLVGRGAQIGNESWFCLNLRHAHWRIVLDPSAIVDHYPAQRSDIDRNAWTHERCYENSFNDIVSKVAFESGITRIKNTIFHLLVGSRYCPGICYVVHALLKRPRALPGIIFGGWSGFIHGMKMANVFRDVPPGIPAKKGSVECIDFVQGIVKINKIKH